HVFERINGHADLADFAGRQRVVGIHADLRRQVESHRQLHLPLVEQIAIALVGLGCGAEACVLAHGPKPAAVHRRVDAAREGNLSPTTGVAPTPARTPASLPKGPPGGAPERGWNAGFPPPFFFFAPLLLALASRPTPPAPDEGGERKWRHSPPQRKPRLPPA